MPERRSSWGSSWSGPVDFLFFPAIIEPKLRFTWGHVWSFNRPRRNTDLPAFKETDDDPCVSRSGVSISDPKCTSINPPLAFQWCSESWCTYYSIPAVWVQSFMCMGSSELDCGWQGDATSHRWEVTGNNSNNNQEHFKWNYRLKNKLLLLR